MKRFKIPEATVIRLSVYSRYLAQLEKLGVITTSSGEIADGVGVSSAQVRKDLAYFGEFGTRGVGYNVKELHRHLTRILGLNRSWPLVIVGAGNLGTALCMYRGFRERGFRVVAMFDRDERKIGFKLDEIPIRPLAELPEVVKTNDVRIGVITVPADSAQEVAEMLVASGVRAVLNFAPKVLSVPQNVELRNVDLSVNLEVLTFNLVQKN